MDLNYLLARHQMSIFAGRNAASPEARCAHRAFTRAYAARVRAFQRAHGATACLATYA